MESPDQGTVRVTGVQWLIIIIASIGFLFDTYELLMTPLVAGPAIAELLKLPLNNPLVTDWVGRLLWISALCGGVFGLLGGWLVDRLGRKTIMAASILLYSLSPFCAAYSNSLPVFVFFRSTTFIGVCVEFVAAITWLAEAFPEYEEGELSRARARLVTSAHLAEVAASLELGKYLRLGRGEEKTGGREKAALRVNALEALVAALFRDGGLDMSRLFIEKFVLPPDLTARSVDLFSTDFKSALQEHLQASRLGPAEYRVVEEKGPEHRKTFTVEVAAGEDLRARGKGKSKKAAEQQAAESLLENLAGKRRTGE